MDVKRTRILEVKKELYPRDDSATLGSIKDVLYAVKKTVNGQALGYIRIFSFDVDDARRFLKAFTRLITKEGFPQDGLDPGCPRQSGRKHPRRGIAAAAVHAQHHRTGAVRVHQHAAEFPDLQVRSGRLGSAAMAAVDRRLGVDGCDLLGRVSAHPRRVVQRHRSGLLRSRSC